MKVNQLMKADVQTCRRNTDLATVAMLMWNYDCGAIPIVDEAGIATDMITDRDIAMGSAFDHKPLYDIPAQQVTNNQKLLTCKVDDSLATALSIMQEGQVHRLPVVDDDGILQGILSMDDLILAASPKSNTASFAQVMETLKEISAPVRHSHRVAAISSSAG